MSAADLDRWEARWRERGAPVGGPEPFLVEELASVAGPVLDVAAGDGRNALWLARQGLAVTAVDIAPAAIARLEAAARECGLSIAGRVADLDTAAALAGLGGPFATLVVVRFKPSTLQWATLLEALRPGGRMLLCSFRTAHHAAHGFPLGYCLDRAELARLLEPRLRLLAWRERDEGSDLLAASVWERPQPAS